MVVKNIMASSDKLTILKNKIQNYDEKYNKSWIKIQGNRMKVASISKTKDQKDIEDILSLYKSAQDFIDLQNDIIKLHKQYAKYLEMFVPL